MQRRVFSGRNLHKSRRHPSYPLLVTLWGNRDAIIGFDLFFADGEIAIVESGVGEAIPNS